MDYATIPPLSATVSLMLSEGGKKETFAIQTPEK